MTQDKTFWTSCPSTLKSLLLILILLPAICMLVVMPHADEALMIHYAKQLSEGAVPYIDFSNFLFPGIFYIAGMLFKVTGPTVIGARLIVFGCILSAYWALFLMARPYLKPWTRVVFAVFLVMGILPNTYIYSHHGITGPLSVWICWCFVQHHRSQNVKYLTIAGLLTAITLLTTQSIGTFLLAGGAGLILTKQFLSQEKKPHLSQQIVSFAGSALGLIFLAFGGLWLIGVFDAFMKESVLWLLEGRYSKTTVFYYCYNGFMEILNVFVNHQNHQFLGVRWQTLPLVIQLIAMSWLPMLGMLWLIQRLVQNRSHITKPIRWEFLILGVFALVELASTLSLSTTYHIGVACGVVYLLAFLALQSLLAKRPWLAKGAVVLALLFYFGISFIRVLGFTMVFNDENNWVPSYGTVEGRFLNIEGPHITQLMKLMVPLLHEALEPNEPFLVFNASPELYLLSDRKPLSRYHWIYPHYLSESQLTEIYSQLKLTPPKIVIYDAKDMTIFETDPRYFGLDGNTPAFNKIRQQVNQSYQAEPLGYGVVLFHQPGLFDDLKESEQSP